MADNLTTPAATGTVLALKQMTINGASALVAQNLIVDTAGADPIGTADGNAGTNTLLGFLKAIKAALLGTLNVSFTSTPTVNVGASALPAGAATAAGQASAQTSLTSIAASTAPSIFWNTATGAASALAASATFTGTARDSGVAAGTASGISYFNSFFLADQAGTARIDGSNDGATWYTVATAALTAGSPLLLTVPVMTRYHRAVVVNGATAQTSLVVNNAYTGA